MKGLFIGPVGLLLLLTALKRRRVNILSRRHAFFWTPCARLERLLLFRPAFGRRDFNIPAHGFGLTFRKGLTVGHLIKRPGIFVFQVPVLKGRGLGQLTLPLGLSLKGLHVGPVGLLLLLTVLKRRRISHIRFRLDFLPVGFQARLEKLLRQPLPLRGRLIRTGCLRPGYFLAGGRSPRPDLLLRYLPFFGYIRTQVRINRRGFFFYA